MSGVEGPRSGLTPRRGQRPRFGNRRKAELGPARQPWTPQLTFCVIAHTFYSLRSILRKQISQGTSALALGEIGERSKPAKLADWLTWFRSDESGSILNVAGLVVASVLLLLKLEDSQPGSPSNHQNGVADLRQRRNVRSVKSHLRRHQTPRQRRNHVSACYSRPSPVTHLSRHCAYRLP